MKRITPLKKKRKTLKKNSLTILELLIGISILIIAGGALCFQMKNLLEHKQFHSDANRISNLLISSRALAINTKMDWRLELKKNDRGWGICLRCLEQPDLSSHLHGLSPLEFTFEGEIVVQAFAVDFFSSGYVLPKGKLSTESVMGKCSWTLPELFKLEENKVPAPFFPSA